MEYQCAFVFPAVGLPVLCRPQSFGGGLGGAVGFDALYQHGHVGEALVCGFERGCGIVEGGSDLCGLGFEIGVVEQVVLYSLLIWCGKE
jgi:hypothetical protein